MMAPINIQQNLKKSLGLYFFMPTFAGTFSMFVGHDRFLVYIFTVLNSKLNIELNFCNVLVQIVCGPPVLCCKVKK